MKKYIQSTFKVAAGFVAGIVFLISCGGGGSNSNSNSNGFFVNSVNAANASEQIICTSEGDNTWDSIIANDLQGDTVTSLSCRGKNSYFNGETSLESLLNDGWLVMSFPNDNVIIFVK